MSKPEIIYVGVDVSAKKHDLAIEINGKWLQSKFENSESGHAALIRYLRKRGKEAHVCIEATGIYHLDLALALHEADHVQVMVINPRASKDFARAMMQRSKTDQADARSLAAYAQRMEFRAWQPPRQAVWDLRDLSRRSGVLTQSRASEKNRIHVSRNKTITNDIEVNIRHLDRRLQLLKNAALELINGDDELLTIFTLLITIKGIAETSAIRIMGEVMMLPSDMRARQWVAHAGLDPRDFESGSSVKKRVRISKVGNIHLRNALYMSALSASIHDKNVKAFREVLEERGKTPLQAIVAVMRKLLHTIHGMLKNMEPYHSELFYQPMQKKA